MALDLMKEKGVPLEYQAKAASDQAKIEQMMLYGQITACRWKFLQDYFGESFQERCGHCDNCLLPQEQRLGSAVRRRGT